MIHTLHLTSSTHLALPTTHTIPPICSIIHLKRLQSCSGAGFSNELRETISYGEFLKHGFYLIIWHLRWVSYSNNFINYQYNKARCILIHNFLELGKILVSKVHRKIRSPVNRSRKRPLNKKLFLTPFFHTLILHAYAFHDSNLPRLSIIPYLHAYSQTAFFTTPWEKFFLSFTA